MNYYPFHIGDFAAHTAHLTWEEDIAYRRMLDWYYLNERALPLDAQKVARLIRMPKSLQTIEAVLVEFFFKSDDGWHNKRADEELTSMLAKQDQQAIKDEHEAERMRRHRGRRAEMFAALRAVHIVPAWDVPMKELQRLHDEYCNAPATEPETHLQREQVVSCNATATAIPTPTPTPTPNKVERASPTGSRLPTDWQLPDDWAAWARQERPELDPNETAQRFADYWHGVAGAKGRKADWLATWRNWVRNEKAKPVSFAQQAADVARVTVPGPVGPDPALIRIEEDRKRAVPMPDSVRAVINTLTRKVG